MINNKFNLDEILKNDPLGILDYKKRDIVKSNDQRLVDSFLEINKFYKKNNRKPKKASDIHERGLFAILKGIKENLEKVSFLKKYDKYNLLENIEKQTQVESIDDIFNSDPLGILSNEEIDIFTLKNIPDIKKDRAEADFIARREKCEDFEKYESIFQKYQDDLESGEKILKNFNHGDIQEKSIFVDKGILVFIERIEMENLKDSYGKEDGRLLCVFENGTKSNIKFRTLQKSLEIDGQTIFDTQNHIPIINSFSDSLDTETGHIYILKSLSNDDQIITIKNLYKIGFSSGPVKNRIENAEKDPTYLMAPVAIVSSFKTFNMNPQKLEKILHQFFGNSRLNIEIIDKNKRPYYPTEWFTAPLNIIETAVGMIVNGSILNYRYDSEKEKIKIIEN